MKVVKADIEDLEDDAGKGRKISQCEAFRVHELPIIS